MGIYVDKITKIMEKEADKAQTVNKFWGYLAQLLEWVLLVPEVVGSNLTEQ